MEEEGDESGESASLPRPTPIDPMLDKSQVSVFVLSLLALLVQKYKY